MTKIPYGNYKFYYTYGKGWAEEAEFKSIQSAGNLPLDMEFQKAMIGEILSLNGDTTVPILKLQLVSNFNLETESASEDEI